MVVAHARREEPWGLPVVADAALALLGSTTAELLAPSEPSALLELIVQNMASLAGTTHGYLCLIEPDGRFTVRAGTGIFENLVGYRCPPGGGLSGLVGELDGRAIVADHATWSRLCKDAAELGAGPLIEVPLSMKTRGRGTLGAVFFDDDEAFGS